MAECGVATDDDRHVYRRKTMKDREQGAGKYTRKIIGHRNIQEEVFQEKKEKYLEPVCERRAGPKDWRRRGP